LEVGITYNRMLCNYFTGPARFRLNMPEVSLELKRVWHPSPRCFNDLFPYLVWPCKCIDYFVKNWYSL